jgi:hypothetical protein
LAAEKGAPVLKVKETIQLSASDLVGHLNCRNLTELDLAVAKGDLAKPKVWDPGEAPLCSGPLAGRCELRHANGQKRPLLV